MRLKVGTLPWLLWHELQLWWRELRGKWLIVAGALIFSVVLILLVTVWMAVFSTNPGLRTTWSSITQSDAALWTAVVIWIFMFLYLFPLAMGQSVIALFDRGDLDLLVASPMSSQVIFASRLLSVAIELFLGLCLFAVPISFFLLLSGLFQLLGIFPALMGLTLSTASLAMLLTLWLVKLFGARRARTIAQVLTLVLTAIVFIAAQAPNLFQRSDPRGFSNWLAQMQPWFGGSGLLGAGSWLWFPARAMFFDLPSVLLTGLVSGGLAWLTVETLHRSFIDGTQQSVTLKQSRRPVQETRFTSGLNQIVLLKEWRVIGRNPYLLSQTFLSIVFLIPLLFVLWRNDRGSAIASLSTVVTSAGVLIGCNLASTMTLICLSGEEAPDLLKSAPVVGTQLRRLKLLAALIPVWLVLSPLFVILLLKGEAWVLPLLVFVGATTCTATLRLWNSKPISLAGLIARRRQNPSSDVVLGLLEGVDVVAWIVVGFQLNSGNGAAVVVALMVIAGVMVMAYHRSRQLGTSLGF